jgi:branched-chain amino acid transport system permease protein
MPVSVGDSDSESQNTTEQRLPSDIALGRDPRATGPRRNPPPRAIHSWIHVVAAATILTAPGVVAISTGRVDVEELLFQLATVVTFAVTWNLIGGLGGQHSFAQPVFFGIGAYCAGIILVRDPTVPMAIVALVAAAVATAVAFVLTPCFRASGPYFAILTVAVAEGLRVTADTFAPGKSDGLILPFQAAPSNAVIMGAALCVAVAIVITYRIVETSQLGISLRLIQADEMAAKAIAVPVTRVKALAFIIGAPPIAVLGSLFAVNQTVITPDSVFDLSFAIAAVIATMLGGLGTFWGPIIGSYVWIFMSQGLRDLIPTPGLVLLVYGATMLLVILMLPAGLADGAARLGRLLTGLFFRPQPAKARL